MFDSEDYNKEDDVNDDEAVLSSDLVFSFKNTKSELLDKYPNGKSLNDDLRAVDGSKWEISLFPNGSNMKTENRLTLGLTLVQTNNEEDKATTCEAECIYQVINLSKQKTYSTNISRRLFKLNSTEYDSTFSSSILNEIGANFIILIEIIHLKSKISELDTDDSSKTLVLSSNKQKNSSIRFLSESILKLLNLKRK